jgi:single-strand DNA-binding protein
MKSMKLIGHIGYDAVIKNVNGNEFIEFSVAVNESYEKSDGSKVENTTWFTCTTTKRKLVPFLRKGDPVFVEGNFKVKAYRDKDGNPQVGVDIRAYNIQLLATKKDEEMEAGVNWITQLVQKEIKKAQGASS